jgi:hypothetical protein
LNRRGFLTGMAGILAAGTAPAVLAQGVIMPVRRRLIVPSQRIVPSMTLHPLIQEYQLVRNTEFDDQCGGIHEWLSQDGRSRILVRCSW